QRDLVATGIDDEQMASVVAENDRALRGQMRLTGSAPSRLVVADARQRSVGPTPVGDDLVPRSVVRLHIDRSGARSVLHCHSSSTPSACRGSVARVGAALQTRQLRFVRYEPGDYTAVGSIFGFPGVVRDIAQAATAGCPG